MQLFRVLVVEDFEEFRRFLCSTIQEKTQCQVIGQTSDGLDAVLQAEELQPDLILLDITVPTLNGLDAARRIRKLSPNSKILFVTQHCDSEMVKAALRLGAHGYLLKSDATELSVAVETVLQGGQFLSRRLKTLSGDNGLSEGIAAFEDVLAEAHSNNSNGITGIGETDLETPTFTALIAEDHDDFRRLVRSQLDGKTHCSVIVEALDGLQAIQQAEELQPDLILLDLALPKLNGMDAARRIRKVSPHSKVVFLSQDSSPEIVQGALRLGARGYLLKSDATELPLAVDAILQGTVYISSRLKGA